ncbi:MAG: hypothetical protein ACK5H2_00830 [Beutenbergiaceae bacterium]
MQAVWGRIERPPVKRPAYLRSIVATLVVAALLAIVTDWQGALAALVGGLTAIALVWLWNRQLERRSRRFR